MAEAKTKPTDESIRDYINTLPSEAKKEDAWFIHDFMKDLTKLEPKMWGPSIIGFGSYHYKYDSGHEGDMALLCFSPRKPRMVFYVLTDFEGQEELLSKLGKYKTGKVCLYINKLADVDIEVLKQIIKSAWEDALKKWGN